MKKDKPDCYKCKHRRDLVGDAHSSCDCYSAKVKGNKYGIEGGWFFFPFNFDPVWLEECDSFTEQDLLVTGHAHTEAPTCECPGHKRKINPNDCMCSPDDASDLETCQRDGRMKELTLEDLTKKCKHEWKEDEMFASGAVTLISGSPKDLGEETMVRCKKCGATEYIRMKDLGSIVDIYEEAVKEKMK